MLNRNDPLIGAVQEVMKKNQAERDAVKLVNEKFGVTDRKALPREKQGEWDAAYKSVLTEGLHPNQQKLDVHEPEKDKLTSQDFKMLRAKKKSMEEETLDERVKENKVKKNKIIAKIGAKARKAGDPRHLNNLNGIPGGTGIRQDVGDKIRGRELTSGRERRPLEEADSDVTSPSSMGIKKPDYASGTPDYANKGPQMVNRGAKTSLPSGVTVKEEMTDAQMAKREKIVKALKKKMSGFKERYGERAKDVMYATATKQAMSEEQINERISSTAQRKAQLAPMHTQGIKQTKAITAREPADPQKSFSQKAAEVGRGIEATARGVAAGATDVGLPKSLSDYALDAAAPGRGEKLAKEFPRVNTVARGAGELGALAAGGAGLVKAGVKQAVKQTVKQTASVAGKTDDVAKALSAPAKTVSQAAKEPAATAASKVPTAVDNFITKAKSTPVSPAARETAAAGEKAAANAAKYNKSGTVGGRFSDNLAKARKGSENYGPSKGGVAIRKTTEPAIVKKPGVPAVANRPGLPAVANRPGLPAVANRAGLPARVGSAASTAGNAGRLGKALKYGAVAAGVGAAAYGLSNKPPASTAQPTTSAGGSTPTAPAPKAKPTAPAASTAPAAKKPAAPAPAPAPAKSVAAKPTLQTRYQRDNTIGPSGKPTKGPGGITTGKVTGTTVTQKPMMANRNLPGK